MRTHEGYYYLAAVLAMVPQYIPPEAPETPTGCARLCTYVIPTVQHYYQTAIPTGSEEYNNTVALARARYKLSCGYRI